MTHDQIKSFVTREVEYNEVILVCKHTAATKGYIVDCGDHFDLMKKDFFRFVNSVDINDFDESTDVNFSRIIAIKNVEDILTFETLIKNQK